MDDIRTGLLSYQACIVSLQMCRYMVVSVGSRDSDTPWLRFTASRCQTWRNSWIILSQPYRYAIVSFMNTLEPTLRSSCCTRILVVVVMLHMHPSSGCTCILIVVVVMRLLPSCTLYLGAVLMLTAQIVQCYAWIAFFCMQHIHFP